MTNLHGTDILEAARIAAELREVTANYDIIREAADFLDALTAMGGKAEPVREILVFDWAYIDPKTGYQQYARTPETAEKLKHQGVKITPVYTIDTPASPVQARAGEVTDDEGTKP